MLPDRPFRQPACSRSETSCWVDRLDLASREAGRKSPRRCGYVDFGWLRVEIKEAVPVSPALSTRMPQAGQRLIEACQRFVAEGRRAELCGCEAQDSFEGRVIHAEIVLSHELVIVTVVHAQNPLGLRLNRPRALISRGR